MVRGRVVVYYGAVRVRRRAVIRLLLAGAPYPPMSALASFIDSTMCSGSVGDGSNSKWA